MFLSSVRVETDLISGRGVISLSPDRSVTNLSPSRGVTRLSPGRGALTLSSGRGVTFLKLIFFDKDGQWYLPEVFGLYPRLQG